MLSNNQTKPRKSLLTCVLRLSVITTLCFPLANTVSAAEWLSDGAFDKLNVGSPPNFDQPAGAWFIPQEIGESGDYNFSIAETAGFDSGAVGNSLAVAPPDSARTATAVVNVFDDMIHEKEGELVRATFDIYIPSTETPGRPGLNLFIGGDHGGGFPYDRITDRGPQVVWDEDGRLSSWECNPTNACDGYLDSVHLATTPLDEWQHVRLDIDLVNDTYDLFWGTQGEVELVSPYIDFRSQHQAFLDRIGIAFFNNPELEYKEGSVYLDNFQLEVLPKIPGDADLNGKVEFADFLALSDGFGKQGSWSQGDFDGDERVEFADFLVLADHFGESAEAAIFSVPEPGILPLSLTGFFFAMYLRTRRDTVKDPASLPRRRRTLRCSSTETLEPRCLLTTIGFTAHEVPTQGHTDSLFSADIDGDNDLDIVSAEAGTPAWYRNTDGTGSFGSAIPIDSQLGQASSVIVSDLDGDGDNDVLTTSYNGNLVSWYRNTDGQGAFGSQLAVAEMPGPRNLSIADVDGDGDNDVFVTSSFHGGFQGFGRIPSSYRVFLLENIGNGKFGHEREILSHEHCDWREMTPADVDSDGDVDLIATCNFVGIVWLENEDGQGSFGSPRPIELVDDHEDYGITSVHADDLDGDGDLDVLAASSYPDCCLGDGSGWDINIRAMWYENIDGLGTFSSPALISQAPNQAYSGDIETRFPYHRVRAADIDGDGDSDVLTAGAFGAVSSPNGQISWFENSLDENGHRFAQRHDITESGEASAILIPADVDNDGDTDVITTSSSGDGIDWYESSAADPRPRVLGDANGNGEVAFSDFLLLAENFGKQVDAVWSDGDFNDDGKVEFEDFLILAENYGKTSLSG